MSAGGGVAEAPELAGSGPIGKREVTRQLAAARARLERKLNDVDLATVGLSEYNQRYLKHKLSVVEGELQQVSDLLTMCLADSAVPLDRFTLLDYGGGSGVISLLAKELGIGTVVYNDIYDVSCRDASALADAVGVQLDGVVCGDIDQVLAYLREQGRELNAVVSYDVLEHIYDVPSFFRALATAPTSERFFRLVFASGANIKNARYVRYATKVQTTDELEGTEPEWGHKERDAVRPFLEIRRELIAAAAPDLDSAQVDQLARATRGLRRDDIERAVAEHRERGEISYRADHPTNTCDPYTGNWSEHLMDPAWLERVVREAGFDATIEAGRYATAGGGAKAAAKRLLNSGIAVLGPRALAVAPYYVVYAGSAPTAGRER
jgi:hypothetical protein